MFMNGAMIIILRIIMGFHRRKIRLGLLKAACALYAEGAGSLTAQGPELLTGIMEILISGMVMSVSGCAGRRNKDFIRKHYNFAG